MIRNIVHDPLSLSKKSEPASEKDMEVVRDLLDTLKAHREECVGMAANMIGVHKNIIAVSLGFLQFAMINAQIISKSKPYETEEGCLSLLGKRKTVRYEEIEVKYLDENFVERRGKYAGFSAQIIQHELDHVEGILI